MNFKEGFKRITISISSIILLIGLIYLIGIIPSWHYYFSGDYFLLKALILIPIIAALFNRLFLFLSGFKPKRFQKIFLGLYWEISIISAIVIIMLILATGFYKYILMSKYNELLFLLNIIGNSILIFLIILTIAGLGYGIFILFSWIFNGFKSKIFYNEILKENLP